MNPFPKNTQVTHFLLELEHLLREPQFAAPRKVEIDLASSAQLFCRVRGSNALGILKFTDYYFFYDWDGILLAEHARVMRELHSSNRSFANAEFRMPKLLRMHIPNVISVAVSATSFSPELVELVKQGTFLPGGGEAHQMQAIQIANMQVTCQAENHVRSVAYQETDPINRARGFMHRAVTELEKRAVRGR